ncbi:MAG TPA: asparagine synthase (glutamine-hydrolyzing) [Longimicrobium sp.]|nr:asparagine synthase (glutamine-hydrolyzing) [Longimicrobium sp.]
MCGIAGIVSLSREPVQEWEIASMLRRLEHRGPDDEGVLLEGPVGLGHRRLAVIDLSPAGRQPMFSDDGRYAIVYNGEVYNYLELRDELAPEFASRTRTDTEVLLNAYRRWGEECLHRLNGMFAFAIWDRVAGRLFCARDRFGVKPFYYARERGRLLFASEIPPLLRLLRGPVAPDDQAVFDFLVFNRMDHSDATLFREVRKLPHGHTLTVQDGKVRVRRWYDLAARVGDPFPGPDEFRETLSSAVGLRLRGDVPVGVCLSGGLDSSAIVSLLARDHGRADVHTFSAVYGPGVPGDESRFIDLYRPRLPNMFTVVPTAGSLLADLPALVRAHAEPLPSSSPYAQFKVMELARRHVVVTLDGQGADEQLAGYPYFFGMLFKELLRRGRAGRLVRELVQYAARHRSLQGVGALGYFLLPPGLQTRARAGAAGCLLPGFYRAHAGSGGVAESLYQANSLRGSLLDHFEHKLEHLLKWSDRNSMHFGVESRTPFLDYRLVERTLALGSEQVIRDGMTKHVLRESMRGILPEPIRTRRDKVGFATPQEEWLRAPAFAALARELLGSESFRARGYVDARKALAVHERHQRGEVNAARDIWKWVQLELWFREVVDPQHAGACPAPPPAAGVASPGGGQPAHEAVSGPAG